MLRTRAARIKLVGTPVRALLGWKRAACVCANLSLSRGWRGPLQPAAACRCDVVRGAGAAAQRRRTADLLPPETLRAQNTRNGGQLQVLLRTLQQTSAAGPSSRGKPLATAKQITEQVPRGPRTLGCQFNHKSVLFSPSPPSWPPYQAARGQPCCPAAPSPGLGPAARACRLRMYLGAPTRGGGVDGAPSRVLGPHCVAVHCWRQPRRGNAALTYLEPTKTAMRGGGMQHIAIGRCSLGGKQVGVWVCAAEQIMWRAAQRSILVHMKLLFRDACQAD